MLQAYKYRMYPNREQVASPMQHIHACRFVYNSSLEHKIGAYERGGQRLSCSDLNTRLPALKEEHPWLKDVNSQSLQSANKNLDNAFTRFFREKNGLEHKCRKYGKTLLKIGRFEPSSKLCSTCGYLKRDLTLADREWTCPDCDTHHDRDSNAAINIKKIRSPENRVGVSGVERTEEPVDPLPLGRRRKQEAPPERSGVVDMITPGD